MWFAKPFYLKHQHKKHQYERVADDDHVADHEAHLSGSSTEVVNDDDDEEEEEVSLNGYIYIYIYMIQ